MGVEDATANKLLARTSAFVTDSGANMQAATRIVIGAYTGTGNRVARLCVCHMLQLLLKWFCLADVLLADALACCAFMAMTTNSSEYAREWVRDALSL